MANERNRTDDQEDSGQDTGTDMSEERLRGGGGDDVRGIADEEEDEFDDDELDDLEEDEEDESAL
jgi:hypothetical protein